ncbi:MAG: hypothetical protein WAU88_13610 [Candidatus Zixiibacteriota bacterium]
MQTTAQLILLDSTNALKTDYDLTVEPISLLIGTGTLNPSQLIDSTLFSGGIVNFLPSGVTYAGPSGKFPIHVTNGSVASSDVIVSFNGYDILKVFDFKGDPLTQVYQGLPTAIRAAVRNGGSLLASTNPSLKTYFSSGGGSIKAFFQPHNNGTIDTVTIIDTAFVTPGSDTLVLQLDSKYLIGGNTFTVSSLSKLPVTVLTPASIALVDRSFKPDSAYVATSFPMSFAVKTTGFSGPIDSATAVVKLYDSNSGLPAATLFDAPISFSSFTNDTIKYGGLVGKIDQSLALTPGWYPVHLAYRLISGGSVFTIPDQRVDSMYVLPQTGPSYVAGSLAPDHVAAGAEASFQFKLLVNNGGVEIEPGTAIFSLAGTGFAATVNIVIPGDFLAHGENILKSENIFVPGNQLDKILTATAELHFRLPGAATYLIYQTNFGGQSISVQQLPVVQIVRADMVAPNPPKINTRQAFEISAQIANLSSSPSDSLVLRLTSDGGSVDSQFVTVPQIPAMDTVTALFNVVAANQSNDVEVFSVDIVSADAQILPPQDNIALVTIQNPAVLVLTHDVVGTQGGFVSYGQQFSLVIGLSNLFRQGGITDASYILSTGGVDLGVPAVDTIGQLSDRSGLTFAFRAPSVDTTLRITFTITDPPLDLNTGLPASLTNTVYQFTLRVISGQSELAIGSTILRTVPIVINEQAELFSLNFSNGTSVGGSSIKVLTLSLRFSNRLGELINIHDMFDLSQTGLYSGDQLLTTATVLDNEMVLGVADDSLVIPAADNRSLTFRGLLRTELTQGLGIRLDSSSVDAVFVGGPNQGESAIVTPAVHGQAILSQLFAVSQSDFSTSFMVENNPWHPGSGEARFAYNLSQQTSLEFRILTLTGELVLEQKFPEGDPKTTSGSHILTWDGKNGGGDIVRDGVYIVMLRDVVTGVTSKLKLAVVK